MILLKKYQIPKHRTKLNTIQNKIKKNESPKNIGLNPNANVCINDNYFF